MWTDPYTNDPRWASWARSFWGPIGWNVDGISHTWAQPGRYELRIQTRGRLRENLGACLHDYEHEVLTHTITILVNEPTPTPSPSPTLGIPTPGV